MRNRLPLMGRAAIVPASLLASLLGCNSGSPGNNGSTITPDSLAVGLANAFCTAQAACGGGVAVTNDGGTSDAGATTAGAAADGGAASCVGRATLSAEQQLSLVSTAFNEGLLTIDPATSVTCANAYQKTSCADLTGRDGPDVQAAVEDPSCAALFVGYIPIGERCDMTAECTSGSYCLSQGTGQQVTSILGSGSLGTCFPFQGMGAPCNASSDCQSPLTCSPTTFTCGT